MAAGTIPPPLILTDVLPNKKSVPWNCIFELEPQKPDHLVYYTINSNRPAPFDNGLAFSKMNPAQRQTLFYKSKPFWLMNGKRTIKAISVAPDGRESACVTKVFQIQKQNPELDPNSQSQFDELAVDCADTLLNMKLSPPKKKTFADVTYSQKSILVDFDDSPPSNSLPKCHYCGCEYAAQSDSVHRFCTQCSKPIPHSKNGEPDQVYQGITYVSV